MKLSKKYKYLLACSYGPDSIFLFYKLIKNNINFDVAYVNYHLPYTGDEEERKLKILCEKYNKKLHIKDAYLEKGNEENWARVERYDFFIKLMKEEHYEATLIAHNLDDLVETFLLQIERGGHYENYGLKYLTYKKGCKFIRPILNFRKKDIIKYLDKNKIDYFVDVTNLEPRFQRNVIRIDKVSKYSTFKCKYIAHYVKKINKKIKKNNKIYRKMIVSNAIPLKTIRKSSFDLFFELFHYYLSLFDFIKKISKDEIKEIYETCKKKSNSTINLNDEYYVFIEYGYLKIDKFYDNKYQFVLTPSGNEYFTFKKGNLFDKYFSNNGKIIVASIKKDDYYLYGDKKKRASHIFIDMKLPKAYRTIWPGVYDLDGNLVYVPRYRSDFRKGEETFIVFDLESIKNIK